MRGKVWSVVVIGAVLLLGTGVAAAQFSPRARPLYGQANLRSGFMPDPHILSGNMGGPIQANQLNTSCRGYVSGPPNHVIVTNSGFRQIRFAVNAGSDSTLVVMLPNGSLLCDDDGGEGLNPLITTQSPPGRIAVWVGAYSPSAAGAPYNLGVSELNITTSNIPAPGAGPGPGPVVVQPQQGGSPLQPQLPAAYGSVSLRSGFMPDPNVLSGTAVNGPIQGSQVQPGCRGYYNPGPSHVLMAPTGFRQIRFIVNSGIDTTLMVMLPSGQILCDDDGGSGLNPLISTASPPGAIRVWVGSYSSSRSGPYNIGFSELSNVTTANIPPPGGGGPGPVVVQPVQPPPPVAQVVALTVGIPTTLLGPSMTEQVVAGWNPRGGPPTQVMLQGVNVMAGSTRLESLPRTLRDPTVTVTQQRNGNLVIRAEQPPMGGGDRGQTFLLHVAWQGRPVVVDRWSGTAVERGPRWAR
ncbi:MAG: serine protease [Sandaracinaceae bacterium]|nr:serine protease [Sandaracinaceae bacterium]